MFDLEVKKYSYALYKVALNKNEVALVSNDILHFKKEYDLISKTINYFNLDILSKNQQLEILNIILDNIKASELLRNFIKILVEDNNINLLKDFLNSWDNLSKEFAGYDKIEIITVDDLLEDQENRIKELLDKYFGEKYFIVKIIDPNIIGGLIIRSKDFEFNDSILGRLNNISKNIKGELLNE